jgi:hypothetical protein
MFDNEATEYRVVYEDRDEIEIDGKTLRIPEGMELTPEILREHGVTNDYIRKQLTYHLGEGFCPAEMSTNRTTKFEGRICNAGQIGEKSYPFCSHHHYLKAVKEHQDAQKKINELYNQVRRLKKLNAQRVSTISQHEEALIQKDNENSHLARENSHLLGEIKSLRAIEIRVVSTGTSTGAVSPNYLQIAFYLIAIVALIPYFNIGAHHLFTVATPYYVYVQSAYTYVQSAYTITAHYFHLHIYLRLLRLLPSLTNLRLLHLRLLPSPTNLRLLST